MRLWISRHGQGGKPESNYVKKHQTLFVTANVVSIYVSTYVWPFSFRIKEIIFQ